MGNEAEPIPGSWGFRPAQVADVDAAVALIHLSLGEFGTALFGLGDRVLEWQVLSALYIQRGSRFSFEWGEAAEQGGAVVGLLLAVPGKAMLRLDLGFLRQAWRLYGVRRGVRFVRRAVPMAGFKEVERGELMVGNLAVIPEMRGRGIGRQMLARAEDRARQLGLKRMTLTVDLGNPNARRLYGSAGYRSERIFRTPHLAELLHTGGVERMIKDLNQVFFAAYRSKKHLNALVEEDTLINPIGKEFMHLTRYAYLSPSAQSLGEPIPPLELPLPADARLVDLPSPADIVVPALDLRAAIEQRRSLRKYAEQPLSLAELSFLLWATQGVKMVTPRPATLRNVPSAGARHAFETYLLANRVDGLAAGLYRFAAMDHKLLAVDLAEDVAERTVHACADQHMVGQAAVSFIWVALVERMVWRYCERSYRYLHLDAGHVCQNLYLAAEAVGCGACAIAAFDDDLLNQVVGADGEDQFAIYAASLGKKPAR